MIRKTVKYAWFTWAHVAAVVGLLVCGLLLWQALLLWQVWPDWEAYAPGAEMPKSAFITHYELAGSPAAWKPVSLRNISEQMQRAVILAEDVKFYRHPGIDLAALGDAIEHNMQNGGRDLGASTISQQTVKNLFLSAERSLQRKLLELWLTLAMERRLSKDRILELYLNVAEFGPGIYGVEAAAQHYFGKQAAGLDQIEAAQLAATLPSPKMHNPETGTSAFIHRRDKVLWFLAGNYTPPKDAIPPQLVAVTNAVTAPAALTAPPDLTATTTRLPE